MIFLSDLVALQKILVIAVVTILTRALAFIVFPQDKPTPKIITYLGKVLPFAMIAMLVIYCVKQVTPLVYPFALPEIISIGVVVLLHLWKKNSLLSIGLGTVCYMLLVQLVFVT